MGSSGLNEMLMILSSFYTSADISTPIVKAALERSDSLDGAAGRLARRPDSC